MKKSAASLITFGTSGLSLFLISTILGCSSSSGPAQAANSASNSAASIASDIGSLFVHARTTGLCADGQIVDSQVEVHSGMAYLTRDNCVDIAPADQNQVFTQINPLDSSYLVYNTLSYVNALTSFNASVVDTVGNIYSLVIQTAPETLVQYRMVIKVSAQGLLLWSKRLPTDLSSDFASLRLTNTGSLLIAGKTTQQSSHAALLVILDAQGQLISQSAFAPASSQTANFRDVASDSRGNVYAIAEIHHASDNIVDCVVIKLNSAGQILWQKSLSSANAWISQIRLMNDESGLYISGHFDSSTYLGGLAKFTTDGAQEWSSNLPGTVYTIEPSFDGGLVFAGIMQGNSESFIAKLAGPGLVTWSTNFHSPDENLGYTRGITQRSDGSFLVNGLAIRNGGNVVGTVTSLTSSGDIDWSFEVSRSGFDAFQDGESKLLDGKIWMPLRSTITNHGITGILFQFLDQASQPGCTMCTVRTDITGVDASLSLAAGSSFTNLGLLSPIPMNLTLNDVVIHPDVRP